jgi:hypothetical protein
MAAKEIKIMLEWWRAKTKPNNMVISFRKNNQKKAN